jgi:hypothetical protein
VLRIRDVYPRSRILIFTHPGSRILNTVFDPAPGSGIRNRFFPDPGSRIQDPNHIFLEISDKFLNKKFKFFENWPKFLA